MFRYEHVKTMRKAGGRVRTEKDGRITIGYERPSGDETVVETGFDTRSGWGYKLDGKKLIRFRDDARDAADKRAEERAKAKREGLRAAAQAIAKVIRSRAREEDWSQDPSTRTVFIVGPLKANAPSLEALAAIAAPFGASVAHHSASSLDKRRSVAVFVGKDALSILPFIYTGGDEVNVERPVRALVKAAGLADIEVSSDSVRLQLQRVPRDVARHASAIARLGAEEIGARQAAAMLKNKELHLWWD